MLRVRTLVLQHIAKQDEEKTTDFLCDTFQTIFALAYKSLQWCCTDARAVRSSSIRSLLDCLLFLLLRSPAAIAQVRRQQGRQQQGAADAAAGLCRGQLGLRWPHRAHAGVGQGPCGGPQLPAGSRLRPPGQSHSTQSIRHLTTCSSLDTLKPQSGQGPCRGAQLLAGRRRRPPGQTPWKLT